MLCTILIAAGLAVTSAATVAAAGPKYSDELLNLARKAGFQPDECETKVLRAAMRTATSSAGDHIAYCGPKDLSDDGNDPSKADTWPASRQVSAVLIRWLCTNPDAIKLVDPEGIFIVGAKFADQLDLRSVTVPFPLAIEKSRITKETLLRDADLRFLSLLGSWTGPITAERLHVRGILSLPRVHVDGEANFLDAMIDGQLNAGGATFNNRGEDALNANGANIKGAVFLNKLTADAKVSSGFTAEGEVNFVNATIGSSFDATSGTFKNPGKFALNSNGANIKGAVFLSDNFTAEGEVNFANATIGGNLEGDGGTFKNPGKDPLNAGGASVKGQVLLDNFTADGEVNFVGATIDSDLSCSDGVFASGSSLVAERAKVAGTFW